MNQNEEIQRLRAENEKLKMANEGFAALGDLMKTMVLLPLSDAEKTDEIRERIGVALMIHGIDLHSPASNTIIAAMTVMLKTDHERLVRLGLGAADAKRRAGKPVVTPGCDCTLCKTVASAMTIEGRPTRRSKRASEEAAMGDYPLTKMLATQRDDPAETAKSQKMATDILTMFDAMGLINGMPMPGDADPLSLLFDILLGGGAPGGRSPGGRSRRGSPRSGLIEAFLLGPGGLQRLDVDEG